MSCVAIDFASCRLRYEDETDEEWRRAKEFEDEEGNLGTAIQRVLRQAIQQHSSSHSTTFAPAIHPKLSLHSSSTPPLAPAIHSEQSTFPLPPAFHSDESSMPLLIHDNGETRRDTPGTNAQHWESGRDVWKYRDRGRWDRQLSTEEQAAYEEDPCWGLHDRRKPLRSGSKFTQ